MTKIISEKHFLMYIYKMDFLKFGLNVLAIIMVMKIVETL